MRANFTGMATNIVLAGPKLAAGILGKSHALTADGVESLADCSEKCLVRKMGYQLYVDMHVQVDPQMTVLRSHEIAHAVKDKVRRQIPAVKDVLVHIEPATHANNDRKS